MVETRYLYVGNRYYETAKVPVRFPFGFGLSYTTFSYSELSLTPHGASFTITITNTGTTAGAEIAQLYVGRTGEGVHRPAKELKGFTKIYLQAGESQQVMIPLDDKAFRHFDTNTGSWQIESALFSVMIGASVAGIRECPAAEPHFTCLWKLNSGGVGGFITVVDRSHSRFTGRAKQWGRAVRERTRGFNVPRSSGPVPCTSTPARPGA